jgi:hypothetical protein
MNTRFGLIAAAAVVMLVGFVGTGTAQTLVLSDVQYTPAANQNKAKTDPKGTMSLPGDGATYRAYCDYGTFTNGAFVPDGTVSAGGPSAQNVVSRQGGNHNWTSAAVHELNNVPAGLHCRARLQKWNAQNSTWDYVAGTYEYKTVL